MVQGWIHKSLFCLLLQITYGSGDQKERNSTADSNLAQVRLLHSLLDGYEKDLRPVKYWKNGTTVNIDITIYSIFAADEKNQLVSMYFLYNRYWTDEFLTWNALEYDNITVISLPSNIVWVPDVLITEFVSSETPPFRSFVYIHNTGLVNYQKPLRMSSMCIFYIYYFPFDQQNCTLTFQSQLHTVEHINVSMWRKSEEMMKDLQKFYDKGEWELLSINSNYKVVDELGRKFGVVEYYVSFRRHPMYYIVNLIIPSAFLILMDIIGFYLPPESGERVTFKITLLLGYSVFLIVVSETLPASAQGAPIIDELSKYCENGGNFNISTTTLLMKENPEILQSIFNEIVALRQHLEKKDLQENANEWLSVGYVLDKFLFWVYVATILSYIATTYSNTLVHFLDLNISIQNNIINTSTYEANRQQQPYTDRQLPFANLAYQHTMKPVYAFEEKLF
ncbi:5-hydroxytryptamine receptor 3A-like [Hyla sarda]|uniref:5-hydroxytryptamine receptor 3A-like n=1 Tax=Hyla sarda TaxID=327740 RepID=UPI0024C28E46|nr:5-hydroxytryptamine receptor 3A-like [Hyla sarda]